MIRKTLPLCCFCALFATNALNAAPFISPNDIVLRNDLTLLADSGILSQIPFSWPLSWNDVLNGIEDAPSELFTPEVEAALQRVRREGQLAKSLGGHVTHVRLGVTNQPSLTRDFDQIPRERGEIEFALDWTSRNMAAQVNIVRVFDAIDDDYRLDDSYISLALGNWAVSAGTQSRWWGPGYQSNLVLSTNARPTPQLSIQRIGSQPFGARWLQWIGPWTMTAFMGRLDDVRTINDALLFGTRVTARPLPNLEIGISRTAQWCGDGRPCNLSSFKNLLLGNDNRTVNVGDGAEPGNQLGGFDVRWGLPKLPYAIYLQWIGEDTRQGGPQIGSWMRQLGAEHWGTTTSGWQHRSYLEITDTTCQEGGAGFGGDKFDCGYQHGIFSSGYRYYRQSIGHTLDGDTVAVSVGTLLIGPSGQSWRINFQKANVNDGPISSRPHSISRTPADYVEATITHERDMAFGAVVLQLRLEDLSPNTANHKDRAGVSAQWIYEF